MRKKSIKIDIYIYLLKFVCGICMYAHDHTCVYMQKPHINIKWLPLSLSTWFLWQCHIRLGSQWVQEILSSGSPLLGSQVEPLCLARTWMLGMQPDPHTYTARTLPTEPSPQPAKKLRRSRDGRISGPHCPVKAPNRKVCNATTTLKTFAQPSVCLCFKWLSFFLSSSLVF